MNLGMLGGAIIGLGVFVGLRGLVPPRVDKAAAVGRWEHERRHAVREQHSDDDGWRARLGAWLSGSIARQGWDLPLAWRADLAVVERSNAMIQGSGSERSVQQWLARVVIVAVAGLLMAITGGMLLESIGGPVGFGFGLIAAPVFAGFLVYAEISTLQERADQRRAELRRTLSLFLDQVSMQLASKIAITEALPTAAKIGVGWTFETLDEAIRTARERGLTPWEALGEVGDFYNLRELSDLAGALMLVDDTGAKIRQSLASRAATLRHHRLMDARAYADKVSAAINSTIWILVLGFFILLIYPGMAAFDSL